MKADAVKTPTISIKQGKLQGEVHSGVHRFLGIPYAEPPFGENRFRSPVDRAPWQGVLAATQYGAICPQTGGIGMGLPDEGEDCLNLNIWTPDPSAKDLPVMVWAHGGGQVSGSGANPVYDGTHFAKDGVVLVTCNRRLGAEGFLYLEELFGEGLGPGNLGIQDLICVLRWVAENIQSFGGNPNNVTLFGESGGAAASQAVVATPESKGLLNRVILQSGGHAAQRVDTATEISRQTLKLLNIREGDLPALQSTHWSRFIDIYSQLESIERLGQPQIYLPVLNQHMPVHPVDAVDNGRALDYLVGTCRDEINLFAALLPDLQGSMFHKRAVQVSDAAEVSFQSVLDAYRQSRHELDDELAFKAAVGDLWFRLPSIRIAEQHANLSARATFMYLFEWESPLLGAAHALDLIVFGNGTPLPGLGGLSNYEDVATRMRNAWVGFAADGKPTSAWPQYDEQRLTMSFGKADQILQDPYQQQREVLKKVIKQDWQSLGL